MDVQKCPSTLEFEPSSHLYDQAFGVIAQHQDAKAVLATMWPVADQSTATLMAEMYRCRQDQKLTKSDALRQAHLSLQSQDRYAHPFYWAQFILMGNWL